MGNDTVYFIILFLIFAGIMTGFQIIYASSQGAPQCAFSRDMITCIEIARSNK